MAFPPQFLDELRSRLALADVIGRRVKLQRRGRDFVGLCPFHNEKTPSFTVNEEKGFFHCFGCGAHGDAITFVMRTEGSTFPEAVERLAQEAGLPVPQASPEERRKAERQSTLLGAMEAAARFFEAELKGPRGKAARDYLESRALVEETIHRFRLGYAPDARGALKEALTKQGFPEALLVEAGLLIKPEDGGSAYDRFRGRVIFPIADRRGRVIAFGGRVMGEGQPKYLNSPETPLFHKGRVLFGLAQAAEAIRETSEVVVAEGYMDVIAMSQAGLSQAVAPLGTALTEEQILLLWRLAPEPILCFDGDAAGERAAARAADRALPLLKPGCSLRFALLPPGEDPDSLVRRRGTGALTERLKAALPLAELLWRLETAGRRFDTPERRSGLRQRLGALAARIADRTVQEDYRLEFDRRLEAAFGSRRAAATGGQGAGRGFAPQADRRSPGKGQGWRSATAAGGPTAPGGAAARQGVPDGEQRRQEILLSIVVTHPALIQARAEELAHLTLADPQLDKLRQAVIDLAAGASDLDVEGLKRHLERMGFAGLLDALTIKSKGQTSCRADTDLAVAEEAFDHLLGLMREKQARAEADVAAERLAAEATPEAWARFQAAQRASLAGESRRRDIDKQVK
ncbi:MAG: DNA primase [Pseudomonadota bacterium]